MHDPTAQLKQSTLFNEMHSPTGQVREQYWNVAAQLFSLPHEVLSHKQREAEMLFRGLA